MKEFVAAASRAGLKTKGLISPSWTAYIVQPPHNVLDSWSKITTKTNGRWEITEWYERRSSNKIPVVASSKSMQVGGSVDSLSSGRLAAGVRQSLIEKLSAGA